MSKKLIIKAEVSIESHIDKNECLETEYPYNKVDLNDYIKDLSLPDGPYKITIIVERLNE